MAVEVMNRVENKYLTDAHTCQKLLSVIKNFTEPDEHNREKDFYTISNLYYDTDDSFLIRTSLEKPKYKEKLRLRAYGVPGELDEVYLELKKKCFGTVYKRRAAFDLPGAYEFIHTRCVPERKNTNPQIAKELAFALKKYSPVPKVYIAYDRKAYIGEDGLRITVDANIRTRRHNLRLEDGDYGELLLDRNTYLVETKVHGALPLWLARLFSENEVYPTGFSKYGVEYMKYVREGDTEQCLNPSSARQETLRRCHSHGKVQLPQLA